MNETVGTEAVVQAAETVTEKTPEVVEKVTETVANHPNDIVRVLKYSAEIAGAAAIGFGVYKLGKTIKKKIDNRKESKEDKKGEDNK